MSEQSQFLTWLCELKRELRMCQRFILVLFLLVIVPISSVLGQSAAASEPELLSKVRQLTFEGQRAGEGYFNATGSRMIFQSERDSANPYYQIFLMDLETGDVERLSPGYGKTTCAWIHPSDTLALYASTHEDVEARANSQPYVRCRRNWIFAPLVSSAVTPGIMIITSISSPMTWRAGSAETSPMQKGMMLKVPIRQMVIG